ncbi:EpsG family protein [Enterococcus faecium]|uniref:EpsG family protein n=1 Tax=Enterococcus TaxID=1350 RepID=UPI000CF1E713|nr:MULTISPECIES: EpsG family protein [Enterococcus]MEB4737991.1 EpsG family protein [Enterococcus sp. E5-112]PQC68506.1 EpsG family protein [Enterococcus faecium]PQC73417.1 EpsG family protein [Enterococcus faecium]
MASTTIIHEEESILKHHCKRSNIDKLSSLLIGLFMWILMGFNSYNADYKAYEFLYNRICLYGINSDPGIEVGFKTLMYIFSFFSNNYQVFLCVTSFFCILFLIVIVAKYTNHVAFTLILFFIFGFFSNAIQIRNFISMLFILFAIRVFINTMGKKSYIYYIILVVIASLFHITSLFYLVLVFIKLKKKYINVLIITILLTLLFTGNNLQNYFLDTKFVTYLDGENTAGGLKNVLLLIYFAVNIVIIKKMVFKLTDYNKNSLFYYIYIINLLVSTSFLWVLINNNFIRLIRNIYLLNYVLYSHFFYKFYKKTKIKNYFLLIIYLFYIVFSAYFFTIKGSSIETGFLALFKNNIIFNYLF